MTQHQMALVEELIMKSDNKTSKKDTLSEWFIRNNRNKKRFRLKNRKTKAEIRNVSVEDLRFLGIRGKRRQYENNK